ncbi:MAG: hypothetical protein ACYSVY_24440 [Planctomycetota bacterium]|jgi:uncharacterized membrane protein
MKRIALLSLVPLTLAACEEVVQPELDFAYEPVPAPSFAITAGDFTPTDLGALPGDCCSSAAAMNDARYVVGESNNGGATQAVLWPPTGPIVALAGLGGTTSHAIAINDTEILGVGQDGGGADHVVIWNLTGAITSDLGTFAANGIETVSDMNNSRLIVGQTDFANRAFKWPKDGSLITLSSAVNDCTTHEAIAFAVSDDGYVAGQACGDLEGHLHPVRWTPDGAITALPFPGGGGELGVVLGINNLGGGGQMAGWAEDDSFDQVGVVWSGTAVQASLGAAELLQAINDAGHAVGEAEAGGVKRPFFWSAADGVVTLSLSQGSANDINDDSDVVGWTLNALSDPTATLWTFDDVDGAAEIVAGMQAELTQALADNPGEVPAGDADVFETALLNAAARVDEGDDDAAILQLSAFIYLVDLFVDENPASHVNPCLLELMASGNVAIADLGGKLGAEDSIGEMGAEVNRVVAANPGLIDPEITDALVKKLDDALKKLEADKPKTAMNKLGAFINQTVLLVDTGLAGYTNPCFLLLVASAEVTIEEVGAGV